MPKPNYHKQNTKRARKKRDDLKKKSFTWRPVVGDNLIRVMPPYKEGGDFWFDFAKHYQIGRLKKSFLCRETMLGKRCFLCETNASLRDSENQDERDMAKQIRAVKRSMISIVDMTNASSKQKGPQPYEAPETVVDAILAYYDGEEDDIVDIVDPVNGHNLRLERTGSGIETRYQVLLRPKPTKLADMDWLTKLPDLEEAVGEAPTNAEMKAAWEGRDLDDDDDENEESQESSEEGDDDSEEDENLPDSTDAPATCFGLDFEEDDDDCDECDDRDDCQEKLQKSQDTDTTEEDEELGEPIKSGLEEKLEKAQKAAKKGGKKKKPKK